MNTPLLAVQNKLGAGPLVHWAAFAQEVFMDAINMENDMSIVATQSQTLKPTNMSRLARSMAVNRLPNLAKDSTKMVYPFFGSIHQALLRWTRLSPHETGSEGKVRTSYNLRWMDSTDMQPAIAKAYRAADIALAVYLRRGECVAL